MEKLVIDPEFQRQLNGACVELCDAQGNTVAFCVSPAEYRKLLYDRARNAVTDEELDRAAKRSGGMTTPEVLAQLQKLDRSESGAA